MEIDFSELYKHSGGLASWSPDGRYLAVASQSTLVLRDVRDMSIAHVFQCADAVQRVEWSFDSLYVLAGCFGRAVVDVFSVEQEDWTCRITEGVAGMVNARWAPDGRHILTVAGFHLHLTVWSLLDGSATKLDAPKAPSSAQGDLVAFSPGSGAFAAVAHRKECRDTVAIYDCDTWQRVAQFEPETRDLANLSWSPDGRAILVADCPLDYRLFVYSPDGRRLSEYVAYENALGIKTSQWSPSGQFLAVGSFDESVRVMSQATWRPIVEYIHAHTVAAQSDVHVYREVVVQTSSAEADYSLADPDRDDLDPEVTEYQIETQSCRLQVVNPRSSSGKGGVSTSGGGSGVGRRRGSGGGGTAGRRRAAAGKAAHKAVGGGHPTASDLGLPRVGVGICEWSPDNAYLATRNDSTPHVVWVWETARLGLCAVLIHRNPVRSLKWHPHDPQLAICAGTPKVFLWSPEGASWFDVPAAHFDIRGLRWNPTGCAIVLVQTSRLCSCFLGEHPGDGGAASEKEEVEEMAEGLDSGTDTPLAADAAIKVGAA